MTEPRKTIVLSTGGCLILLATIAALAGALVGIAFVVAKWIIG